MVLQTIIYRLGDGLPLCSSSSSSLEVEDLSKQQSECKKLARSLVSSSPPSVIIDSGSYYIAYIISHNVIYMCVCTESFNKKLAHSFLDDVRKEFDSVHGREVESQARPYRFLKFDTFIQKTLKMYDSNAVQLSQLTNELGQIQHVMAKNIEEVLDRGKKLENIASLSSELSAESKRYRDKSRYLNRLAAFRKYAPLAVAGALSIDRRAHV
eukprot:TRINITY_DN4591_c0_g2_i1.p1 TRINITY_DN4591_c0_g2~~TRINITY_DN4591_c0_g2_i1.p1  ORF type:complete len:211 (+),score=19.50 TRINITY_DN4591_c0_g2_i1:62-694(+)